MIIDYKDELEHLRHQMVIISEVAKQLTLARELAAVLAVVREELDQELKLAELGILYLHDEAGGVLYPASAFGSPPDQLREISLTASQGMLKDLFHLGEPALVGDAERVARIYDEIGLSSEREGGEVVFVAHLYADERIFGLLLLGTATYREEGNHRDLEFIQTLADLIALAIERTRLEEISDSNRLVREAERLRSDVLGTLSHELRTPLAAIKGYSTALLMEEISWPEAKTKEFLHLIDSECDNLQVMISEILDSSMIDAGNFPIQRQPLRLGRLASEVCKELGRRTSAHRLIVDFPMHFPIVDADPLRVKQVLRNIVDNAIKYSPEGGLIVIRGEVRPHDVVIHIADQGVGISPEDLIPLFEKFFRVKSPIGYHVAGTGLGLPIARSIVEAHGGRIWARSEIGEGTEISFSLPRGGASEESMGAE
jgi:signal transduction histidine kinase